MNDLPALVTLHVWGVPTRAIPSALVRMGLHRRSLRTGGPAFARLLGTGRGRTFAVRDADLHHWGLLATWREHADAAAFEQGAVVRSWGRIASERLRVDLGPLSSRGRWARRRPFGDPVAQDPAYGSAYDGPVAVLTRARIAPRQLVRFWRSVPPVAADLHRSPGLRLALGVGEAPVGLQGTFSMWDSGTALTDFAHRRPAHLEAVRRTAECGWYTEELFARFAVLGVQGTFEGRSP